MIDSDLRNKQTSRYKSALSVVCHAITISLGSFFIGVALVTYDIINRSYCSNNQIPPKSSLLLSGVLSLAAVFGAFPLSWILYKRLSRRQSLWIICIIGIAGSLLLLNMSHVRKQSSYCISNKNWQLWLGRVLQGIATGAFTVNCLQLLTEMAPIELKLIIGIFYQLSVELGIITANLIQYSLVQKHNDQSYRNNPNLIYSLITVSIAPLILQILLTMFVFKQQTVKYFFVSGKKQLARSLIQSTYKEQFSQQIFLDYEMQYKTEQNIHSNSIYLQFNMKKIKNISLCIGITLSILQQMSGINFYNTNQPSKSYYPQNVFVPSIIQLFGTILILLFNLSFCQFLQRIFSQRSKIIIRGTIVSVVLTLILTILLFIKNMDIYIYILISDNIILSIFMFTYGFSLGPILLVYSSQILQPTQLQISMAVNWLFAFIMMTGIPLIFDNMLSTKRAICISSLIFCTLFLLSNSIWKYVIETKNKTMLEITRLINDIKQ